MAFVISIVLTMKVWRKRSAKNAHFINTHFFHGNIWTHNWPARNVRGFIAQLVEHRSGIARSRVQTTLKFWIFSSLFTQLHKLRSLRRSFLHFHFTSAFHIWFISYIINIDDFRFQKSEYQILADLKILAFWNPKFKIFDDLNILAFQNSEFKIFAVSILYLSKLPNLSSGCLQDFSFQKSWILLFASLQDFSFLKSWIHLFGWLKDFSFPKSWIHLFG